MKKYNLEIINRNLKVDLRGSGAVSTDAGMEKFLKKVYEKNRPYLDSRQTEKELEIFGDSSNHQSAYKEFRNGVMSMVKREGYSFHDALTKELNSTWWTPYQEVSRRNFINSIKDEKEILYELRKHFGWQSGYDFLNNMVYDAQAVQDYNAQVAYSYAGVIVYRDNSPEDGSAPAWHVVF